MNYLRGIIKRREKIKIEKRVVINYTVGGVGNLNFQVMFFLFRSNRKKRKSKRCLFISRNPFGKFLVIVFLFISPKN